MSVDWHDLDWLFSALVAINYTSAQDKTHLIACDFLDKSVLT